MEQDKVKEFCINIQKSRKLTRCKRIFTSSPCQCDLLLLIMFLILNQNLEFIPHRSMETYFIHFCHRNQIFMNIRTYNTLCKFTIDTLFYFETNFSFTFTVWGVSPILTTAPCGDSLKYIKKYLFWHMWDVDTESNVHS